MNSRPHDKRQHHNVARSENHPLDDRRVALRPEHPYRTSPKTFVVSPHTYSKRQKFGQTKVEYNPSGLKPVEKPPSSPRSKCVIYHDYPTNVKVAYRHFFTTLSERATVLNDLLQEIHDEFVERFDLCSVTHAGIVSVCVPRFVTNYHIGRICKSDHVGHNDATTILLEGLRDTPGGCRVELDLTYLHAQKTPYSLFPGQIILVEGVMYCAGSKILAQRIIAGVPYAPVKSPVAYLSKLHHGGDDCQVGAPLTIVTASGPFTSSDNLKYEPLIDLLSMVKDNQPDVVILTGPFVDIRHKAVAAGQTILFQHVDGVKVDILVPFEVFFANKIAGLLEKLYEKDDLIPTQFVLVPSLDDASAEWVYPQAPFTDRRLGVGTELKIPGGEEFEIGELGLHRVETVGQGAGGSRRVHCVSNPCTFKINEVVIGVTATDVLFDISTHETNANLAPGSRMGVIAEHLLQQRSYYPLFPGALQSNLNLKHSYQWKMPVAPDLLILPSKLQPFARTVMDNTTVVVNPGLLTRLTTGGTYAILNVHAIARDRLENAGGENVEIRHNLQDRIRVEIKHI